MPELKTVAHCDHCNSVCEQAGAFYNTDTQVLLVTYTCTNQQCNCTYFLWDGQFVPGKWQIVMDPLEISKLMHQK